MKPKRPLLTLFANYALLACTGFILLQSCEMTSNVTHRTTYVSSNFSKDLFDSKGLALLPIVAGAGVEGYRRPFGEAMNLVAESTISNFMKWNETLNVLNDAGLVSDYNSAIRAYQETGIIDRNILSKMAEATKCKYFFFVNLSPPKVDQRASYNYLSGGVSTTVTQSVSAFGIVWSADDGDVVWEGDASAAVVTGPYDYTTETDIDRSTKVAKALMANLIK